MKKNEKAEVLGLKKTGAYEFELGQPKKTPGYQVFLTFRDVDKNGDPTYDSVLARQVYRFLTEKGLNVFQKATVLEDSQVDAVEKAAEVALNVSPILVVVGMSLANINFEKVHVQWSCFDNFIHGGAKLAKLLISYIKDVAGAELPSILQKHEIFEDKNDSLDRLVQLIKVTLGIKDKIQKKDSAAQELYWERRGILLEKMSGEGPEKMTLPFEALTKGVMVGRSNDNYLVLYLEHVSRHHAILKYAKDGVWLEDLNSTNGTFINDEKITRKTIKPGDMVRFDVTTYAVCLPENNED